MRAIAAMCYIVIGAGILVGGSSISQATTSPKARIEQSIGDVITMLKTEEGDKLGKIKERMAGLFSYSEMARRTIAKKDWLALNDTQKVEFADLFKQLLELTYMDKLSTYTDEKVVYLDEKYNKSKSKVSVATKIITEKAEIPLDYRLFLDKTQKEWFVYDVKVEGIGLVSNYRSQFESIMAKKKYDGLRMRLINRIDELKKAKEEAAK